MKVLLAINMEELEDFVAGLPQVEVTGTVREKSAVVAACEADCPEVILMSGYLEGPEDIRQTITAIKSGQHSGIRIVFLYGEEDDACGDFISFLQDVGVNEYKTGSVLTAQDIEELLFYKSYTVRKGYGDSRRYLNLTGNKKTGVERKIIVKELDKAVITLYSNHSTGKSHTAWNLSHCFAGRGYRVCLVNIDRGYSANLYYGIDKRYYELLECVTDSGRLASILDYCYRRRNLYVVTGRCGSEETLEEKDFSQLLYAVRSKCDITLVDTRTGLDTNTLAALKHSTVDLLIFDSDLQHFHMNMKMLDEMGADFIPEKTIAVINNSDIRSSSYRFIYNEMKKLKLPFRGIMPLSACSSLSQDLMYGDKVPYQFNIDETKDFRRDMDSILEAINCRAKRGSILQRMLSAL